MPNRTNSILQAISVAAFALTTALPLYAADVELTVGVDEPGSASAPPLRHLLRRHQLRRRRRPERRARQKRRLRVPPVPDGLDRDLPDGKASPASVAVLDEAPRSAANANYLRLEVDEGATRDGGPRRRWSTKASAAWASARATPTTSPPGCGRPPAATPNVTVRLVAPEGKTIAEATHRSQRLRMAAHRQPSSSRQTTEPMAHLELSRPLVERRPGRRRHGLALPPRTRGKTARTACGPTSSRLLADLKPAFFRFPGGCIVEGSQLKYRYQWKQTIGDLADRRLLDQPLEHRVSPPPGARLLPVVRRRLLRVLPAVRGHRRRAACRSSTAAWPASSTRASWCRSTSCEPYIQDALDLIEFANGARRQRVGRPRAAWATPSRSA